MEILNKLLALDPNYMVVGLIILFFMLETAVRRPVDVKGKMSHLFHSFLFQVIAIAMGSLLAWMVVATFDFIEEHQVGLFNWVPVPFGFKVVAGVFLIDFADYWFHRFDHKIPVLWRFHRVHHSDTAMDASTAIRTFPTELIYFTVGELVIAVIFGLDIISMNIFLFILLPVLFIQHTDIAYSEKVDKALGWLLMMPNYHKVHHEQDQVYTDSNYGTLFIIWDRLFGTFRVKPVGEINYGLKEFEGPRKQSFPFLIKSPFMNIKRISGRD